MIKLHVGMIIQAKNVHTRAGYFRKTGGSYVYLRLSPSSVAFHKLSGDKVYGICFNGNTASLDPSTPVVVCDVFDMARNIYGTLVDVEDEEEAGG